MQTNSSNSLNGCYFTQSSLESQDRAVMLELLGWSRNGTTSHLPDDIIGVIKEFTFFDTRTEAYRDYLKQQETKYNMYWVLQDMIFEINMKSDEIDEYFATSKCCYRCGDFTPTGGPLSINTRCVCETLTEEEIDELLYKREEEEERRDELSNKTYAEYMEEMRKERLEEMNDEEWY